MSAEAFADMPSLAELDLSKNKLIADAVDGPIFNLPQLKILNLSFNKLVPETFSIGFLRLGWYCMEIVLHNQCQL